MIITCQNCQTHYSVDPGLLGGGKTVRCENCGNSWHQNPVQAVAPVFAPPPPQQPVYAEAAPFQPAPEPAPAPPPEPAPAPELETMPEPMPEPEAAPEAASEGEAEPAPEAPPKGEAAPKGADDAAGEGADDAAPGAEPEAEADALSSDQLDEMFGEDSEPKGLDSLTDSGGDTGKGNEITELSELENIPDPEPIPQVFSADDDTADDGMEGKSSKGKIIGIAAAVVVIALAAGAFFGRGFIVEMWPEAASIFEMAGIGGEELGAGLEIKNVKSSREVEGGVDVLVVRGSIANISDEDRMVPMIRVALYDGNGEEIQNVIAPPLKNRLQPGTEIGFSAKVPEPSALARRLEVTFTEPEKTGG